LINEFEAKDSEKLFASMPNIERKDRKTGRNKVLEIVVLTFRTQNLFVFVFEGFRSDL